MSPKEAERVRRSATEEELREGADQILEAHLRMEKQAQSQEELPLEDRKEEKHKDKSKYPNGLGRGELGGVLGVSLKQEHLGSLVLLT